MRRGVVTVVGTPVAIVAKHDHPVRISAEGRLDFAEVGRCSRQKLNPVTFMRRYVVFDPAYLVPEIPALGRPQLMTAPFDVYGRMGPAAGGIPNHPKCLVWGF